MPSFCAVSSCEQKYTHSENVSFHKFPLKEPKVLAEWIKFTNRGPNWKPSRWNSICSRHFVKSDFRGDLSRKCLKKDAIATIITKNTISYETFHFSPGSPGDIGTTPSEQDDYVLPTHEDGKGPFDMVEVCRLCGERADGLTCNPIRTLDEPEIELIFRKCLPAVNMHGYMDQNRAICIECITQLRQYSDFIDKVLAYQRELGCNESFDSFAFAVNENSQVNGNASQYSKSSTPNPSTLFIKQEPINVKQEKVDNSNRRSFTVQPPMTSPSMCLNPYAEQKKIKGAMHHEAHSPKTEIGSTYCQLCDRIFGNNFEFRSHKCTSTDLTDREQGNNCEIMEVITLNNPVSYIDLAEDENVSGMEPMKLKTESFSECERKELMEFEHAYAKRATNTSYNLKQEIIDPNNDASENGYDDQSTEHDDQQGFNQSSYFEDSHPTSYDCLKCSQSFVSQELLNEHSASSHPLKIRICFICNAKFKSSYEYLIHKSKVHVNRFQCKQCKQKFNTLTLLRSHQRFCARESKDFYFSCRHCGKSIRNLASMKKHLNNCISKHANFMEEVQHETRDICNRTHSRTKLFKQQMEMHQNREELQRIGADKTEFQSQNNEMIGTGDVRAINLGGGMTNGDSDYKQSFKFIVDESKFIFLNENKVLPVNESNDGPDATGFNGKFACDTCGSPFSSFIQLKQHKLEHDSERKFSCSLCPKTFKGISGLKQHISGYHYKIKPYSCPVCKYSYALKGDMQRCRHSKLKHQSSFKII